MTTTTPIPPPPEAPEVSCEHCTSSSKQQGVDAEKLNGLLDAVKGRLSSDVYGNWFIEGGKLTNDARHGALGLVFNLVSELEAVKMAMDKQKGAQSDVPVAEAKKAGKGGSSLLTTIRSEIEQQLSTPINDLKLRCERLEEQLQKTRTEKGELEKKQFDDSQKIKDLSSKLNKTKIALENKIQQGTPVDPAPKSKSGVQPASDGKQQQKVAASRSSGLIAEVIAFATSRLSSYDGWDQLKEVLLQVGALLQSSLPSSVIEQDLFALMVPIAAIEALEEKDSCHKRTGYFFARYSVKEAPLSASVDTGDVIAKYRSRWECKKDFLESLREVCAGSAENGRIGTRESEYLEYLEGMLALEDSALSIAAKLLGTRREPAC